MATRPAPGLSSSGRKTRPSSRGDAEQGEEAGGDPASVDLQRLAVAAQVERDLGHGGHPLEDLVLGLQGRVVAGSDVVAWEAGDGGVLPDHEEAIGVAEGQRPRSTALTRLKVAVLPPIPRARVASGDQREAGLGS